MFLSLLTVSCSQVEPAIETAEFALAVRPSAATKGYVTGTELVDDSGDPRKLYLAAWMRGSNGRQDNYFANEPFFEDGGKWRHDPPIYVPIQSSFDILGYSSSVPIPDGDVLWGFPNNTERMRLTFGADHLQDDILYGAAYGNMSTSGGAVCMKMYHAQAWIEVDLHRMAGAQGGEVIVGGVTLENLFTGAEVTVDANGGEPFASCRTRHFIAGSHTMADPSGVYGAPLTEGGGSLRILVPEQEQCALVISYNISGVALSTRMELPHATWLMGRHYIYEIVFDPLYEVFVLADVTMKPWVEGTSYSEVI